jgi:hypothetical protein
LTHKVKRENIAIQRSRRACDLKNPSPNFALTLYNGITGRSKSASNARNNKVRHINRATVSLKDSKNLNGLLDIDNFCKNLLHLSTNKGIREASNMMHNRIVHTIINIIGNTI